MKIRHVAAIVLSAFLLSSAHLRAAAPSGRTVFSADDHWKFTLGDPAHAQDIRFDDTAWRSLTLPHDWSIETPPGKDNPSGSSGGYYATGIGWYRKTFQAPPASAGKRVWLEFDGVASNATVYLNGTKLGEHPYAYTSFRYDLTDRLHRSTPNTLAVRVDGSLQPASRWYEGAGIYRHVRIVVTDPVHIAPWGIFVTSPEVSANAASARLQAKLENDSASAALVTFTTDLISPAGKTVRSDSQTISIAPHASSAVQASLTVANPELWSPATPRLYQARTRVLVGGRVVDEVTTSVGLRSVAWSVTNGLTLNGQSLKLFGGSVHHDNGPLGAAAFDRAEVRKVELLKAAGYNAVRTAHNPPSPAFLDACDRLGLLVLDEPFDVWTVNKRRYDYATYFPQWWKQDIDAFILRDRNHASVVLWGIGNEIPEVWTLAGAPLAHEIAERVRALDSSRPLTQAFPGATYGANPDAAIAAVDIAGYNYNLAQNQAEDHRRVPQRIMMTTESFPTDAFEQWSLVQQNPYIVGEFDWTAMDYLGESGIGAWVEGDETLAKQSQQMKGFLHTFMAKMGADGKNPMAAFQDGQPPSPLAPGFPWHGSYCGDLDLIGWRKPWSHYRDILWNGGDKVYAAVRLPAPDGKNIIPTLWGVSPSLPSWTWPGQEGKPLTVEIYSRAESVRLYLNGKLIEEKPTGVAQEFKADFVLPYAAGTLRVDAVRHGAVVAQTSLQTATPAVQLRLTADRTKLAADGQDLSFIEVEAVDPNGQVHYDSNVPLTVTIQGPAILQAAGNGNTADPYGYQGSRVHLFQGRALLIVRSTGQQGAISVTAASGSTTTRTVHLHAEASHAVPAL